MHAARHEWDDRPVRRHAGQRADAVGRYAANAARLGRVAGRRRAEHGGWSARTDMGNVSYLVPSIHPMIQVAPAGVPIHTPEFAEHAGAARRPTAPCSTGPRRMAMTVVDLWVDAGAARRRPDRVRGGHDRRTSTDLRRSWSGAIPGTSRTPP